MKSVRVKMTEDQIRSSSTTGLLNMIETSIKNWASRDLNSNINTNLPALRIIISELRIRIKK